jgi:acyl carrier protein
VTRGAVLKKVQSIVAAELDDPSLRLTEDMQVSALPDWDSVAHFRIIIAIENEFEILFELEEHTEFETIGDVIGCIGRKLAGRVAAAE